jgi:hypothetical protein
MLVNVTFRDNGIRSFIPPCFCFDVVDSNGSIVATVSQIEVGFGDLIECGYPDNGKYSDVAYGRRTVSGHLIEYHTQPTGAAGRRFVLA